MRKTVLLFLLVAVATVAVPASALAGTGWWLPLATGDAPGHTNTSVALHCGSTPFGFYRFYNGTITDGSLGFQAVMFTVELTEDGVRHLTRRHSIRFTRNTTPTVRREVLNVLTHARFQYVAGPSPAVESYWQDGSLQAGRPFNPRQIETPNCR